MHTLRHRFSIACLATALAAAPAFAGGEPVTSAPFQGVKANKGTVTLQQVGTSWTLTLSADFVVPETPAPHWQVVDARGNTFLLQRLVAKDNNFHQTITLPDYVLDVAKVQIWCSFAETLLGETSFGKVVPLQTPPALCAGETSAQFSGKKANKGTVTFGHLGDQRVLTLSADFVVPETPAPHWQVEDSDGRTFLLQRLVAKDGKFNQTVVVPAYVKDVAKVRIWCAFAETLLGEAAFRQAQM
ncbi:MAG TPA: hypothetical protein VFZ65_02900 [Planctomycetota bacterium]|nr:hypothetical protein [Planctomycetota bacterium]